jgi:hypothetical protein
MDITASDWVQGRSLAPSGPNKDKVVYCRTFYSIKMLMYFNGCSKSRGVDLRGALV